MCVCVCLYGESDQGAEEMTGGGTEAWCVGFGVLSKSQEKKDRRGCGWEIERE